MFFVDGVVKNFQRYVYGDEGKAVGQSDKPVAQRKHVHTGQTCLCCNQHFVCLYALQHSPKEGCAWLSLKGLPSEIPNSPSF